MLQALYDAAVSGSSDLAALGQVEESPETIETTGWVTAARLAEDSGWSPRSIRRWAATGRVRAVRVGSQWVIDPESLKGIA